MDARTSKTLALLGGLATLALGSSFMLRLGVARERPLPTRCAPRLLSLERAVCDAPLPQASRRTAPAAP